MKLVALDDPLVVYCDTVLQQTVSGPVGVAGAWGIVPTWIKLALVRVTIEKAFITVNVTSNQPGLL
jgi:hypothetical protein